eukprot:Amastigsp_a516516_14.p2 type:complete len:230 gc:universal Amastigsp_a516516_14:774-85(-)
MASAENALERVPQRREHPRDVGNHGRAARRAERVPAHLDHPAVLLGRGHRSRLLHLPSALEKAVLHPNREPRTGGGQRLVFSKVSDVDEIVGERDHREREIAARRAAKLEHKHVEHVRGVPRQPCAVRLEHVEHDGQELGRLVVEERIPTELPRVADPLGLRARDRDQLFHRAPFRRAAERLQRRCNRLLQLHGNPLKEKHIVGDGEASEVPRRRGGVLRRRLVVRCHG